MLFGIIGAEKFSKDMGRIYKTSLNVKKMETKKDDSKVIKIKPAHEDERRKIFDIVDGEEFAHAGRIIHKKGSRGGAHYHKQTKQVNYILKGKLKYITKDLSKKGSKVKEVILEAGDMMVDPALEWHASEALEETDALFFTKKARQEGGYENDVFRVPLDEIENFELPEDDN